MTPRTRLVGGLLLSCAVAIGTVGLPSGSPADDPTPAEPPVRLRKKVKPPEATTPDKKPDEKPKADVPAPESKSGRTTPPQEKKPERPKALRQKDDPDEPPADTEPDAKEVLERLARNMRSAEDRLGRKDPGEATRQMQGDILKDLDRLIQREQQPPPPSQQQANADPDSQQQQQQRQRQQQQQQKQGGKQNNKGQTAQKSGPGKQPEGQGEKTRDGQGGGTTNKEALSKIADLYKDVWGHLPETLRQEMDAYGREQFMAKYNDLLKQYYATLAEKRRRQPGD